VKRNVERIFSVISLLERETRPTTVWRKDISSKLTLQCWPNCTLAKWCYVSVQKQNSTIFKSGPDVTLHTSRAPALVSVTLKKSCSRALVEAVADGTAVAPQLAGAPVLLAAWSLTGVLASTESVDRRLPGLTTRFSGDRDLSRCIATLLPQSQCIAIRGSLHFTSMASKS